MVELNNDLLEINKKAEICSVYIAADEIEKSLDANSDTIKQLARTIYEYKPEQILFTGSGASYCTVYTGNYFLKTAGTLEAVHAFGPELTADDPPALKNSRTLAIIASYSGNTLDTVKASEYCKKNNIPTIGITRDEKGLVVKNCDHLITYNSRCLYTSAMANLLLLLAEFMELCGEEESAGSMKKALGELPGQMRSILEESDRIALGAVEKLKDEELFYILGDGALWGLAYQYGYTNLMEYARVNAGCLRSCEWRHGPLEIMFRKPAIIMFIGNDESRNYSIGTRDYCKNNGARLIVFDVRDYFSTHPALAPFVLHSVSQLFLLYLCTLNGINMDEYLEMHVRPYLEGETYF